MARRRVMLAGKRKIVKKTVTSSSNSVTFAARLAAPIAITAEFSYVQSGSGYPSPTNIRPIFGHTKCEISQNGALAATIDWQDTAGIIYGGNITLAEDGNVTAQRTTDCCVLNGTTLKATSWVGGSKYFNIPKWNNPSWGAVYACSYVRVGSGIPAPRLQRSNGSGSFWYFVADDAPYFGNVSAVNQLFKDLYDAGTPFEYVWPRNSIETIDLGLMAPVSSVIGQNQIQTNLNGGVTVEYYDYE